MKQRQALVWLLIAGVAFGASVAVVKGQDVDARAALGNTSAPWVVVPFLAGMRYRRFWHGALVGVAITMAALLGFYVAEAAVLDLGPHPWYVDLRLTAGHVYVYEKFGVLSGALYGALGALWASRRSRVAGVALGLAFVAEPLIVLVLWRSGHWGRSLELDYPWMWGGDAARRGHRRRYVPGGGRPEGPFRRLSGGGSSRFTRARRLARRSRLTRSEWLTPTMVAYVSGSLGIISGTPLTITASSCKPTPS